MQTLPATAQTAKDGATGFDINYPLSAKLAKQFTVGYEFCIRYIPRAEGSNSGGDLTNAEAIHILESGLALMCVQHVSKDNWNPTAELGQLYGSYAASYCKEIVGLPEGVCVWLDLEMVSLHTPVQDVIDYCKAWYNEVSSAGYIPGLYIGYQVIINNEQAYELPFKHYWAAYNTDVVPATRGYQMVQKTEKRLNGISFDPNTIHSDKLNGIPIWLKK